jgi:cytochrome c556
MEEASNALFALKPVTFRYKNDPTIAQQHKDFETAITKLRKDMETVVARLQEQDGRIQE